MMKKLSLMLFLLCFLSSAYAVRMKDLYTAEVGVNSQLMEEREEAVRNGLLDVLIRLTGDAKIENNTTIKSVLKRADYYVQEYSYLPSTTTSEKYQIQIKYEAEDLNRLLKRASIPFWGEKRPLILIWLAFTNEGLQTEIIGNENPGNILPVMRDEGKRLGLPLIFPMMDATEMGQISNEDVIQMEISHLKIAAKRYAPDGILMGHINTTADNFYTSEWKLVIGGKEWGWSLSSHTPMELANDIISQVTQTLTKSYAIKKGIANQAWLNLEVNKVTERADLKVLMRFLAQLTEVQKVELSQVTSGNVQLAVLIRSSIEAFQEKAAEGNRLILKSQNDEKNKLVYEWIH